VGYGRFADDTLIQMDRSRETKPSSKHEAVEYVQLIAHTRSPTPDLCLSVRILTALREAQGASLTLDAIAERIVGDKGLESVAGATVRYLWCASAEYPSSAAASPAARHARPPQTGAWFPLRCMSLGQPP
jgi:hypothetical protein